MFDFRNNSYGKRAVLLAASVLAGCSAAWAAAQDLSGLVEQALDQNVTKRIEVQDRPIGEALSQIEQATGVRFALAPSALAALPYGEFTNVTIVLENVPVRQGLRQIFDGLGLTMHVAGDVVQVEPIPAVERMGRRLTAEELALIRKLTTEGWPALKNSVTIEFDARPHAREEQRAQFDAALEATRAASAAEHLEKTTAAVGRFWAPKGNGIEVYERSDDIVRRLMRRISVNYEHVPLDELMVDAGRRVGVSVEFESPTARKIAQREKSVDLVQRNTTVGDLLNLIERNTGLRKRIEADRVVISAPPDAAFTKPGPDQPSRVVAIVRVPVGTDGATVEFLIRDDEVPPEIQQLRAKIMPRVIEILRQELGK